MSRRKPARDHVIDMPPLPVRTPRSNALMCCVLFLCVILCLRMPEPHVNAACAVAQPWNAPAFERRGYSVWLTNATGALAAVNEFLASKPLCTHVVLGLHGVPLADAVAAPRPGEWHGLYDARVKLETVPDMSARFTYKSFAEVPRPLASPAVVAMSTLRRLAAAWTAIHERMLADRETELLWGDLREGYALGFAMAHLDVQLVRSVPSVPADAFDRALVVRFDPALRLHNGNAAWSGCPPPLWAQGERTGEGAAVSAAQHGGIERACKEL